MREGVVGKGVESENGLKKVRAWGGGDSYAHGGQAVGAGAGNEAGAGDGGLGGHDSTVDRDCCVDKGFEFYGTERELTEGWSTDCTD